MHLSEVQIYCADDPTVNVALGKPALQSSVSGWSRKRSRLRDPRQNWFVTWA